MAKIVHREIARSFYHYDGSPIDSEAIRRLLAEFILDSLRNPINRVASLARLDKERVGETDWARDPVVRELVDARNGAFLRHTQQQLINGAAIPRSEAAAAFEFITSGDGKAKVARLRNCWSA